MNNAYRGIAAHFATVALMLCLILGFGSCNPEAPWQTDNVDIRMEVKTVSAGYIECAFSTDKEAYFLIACEEAKPDVNPLDKPKQFMTLALDSANVEYLAWRNELLKKGEFNIAPFASHALQYGSINHIFTNLVPQTDYWVYAFVVNPVTLKPEGKLHLATVTTTEFSAVDIHFEYRVRGIWDYIYPVDSTGKIYDRYPYLAATRDSADLAEIGETPEDFFTEYFLDIMANNLTDNVIYGVKAVENDGWTSYLHFEAGHTYYTAIVAWDGLMGNNVIYRFTWTGENFEAYFKDEDSIVRYGEDD